MSQLQDMKKEMSKRRMINKAYKFRLYPNEVQKEYFAKTFGCVRYFYNRSLYESIEYYKQYKKSINITPATYKKEEECSWLKEVDSLALANAQMQRQVAYKNFFKGQCKFPRFRKKTNIQSYTTNNQGGNIFVNESGRYITLPKIKQVRIKRHRKIVGRIKSCTITKTCDNKYYVSILTEQEEPQKLPFIKNEVGIDLGLKEFAIMSNGEKIDNPKYYEKAEKKLKKEQRKLSLMEKGSSNRNKQRIKVAKAHNHIKQQREDFLQKLSTKIIRENQSIFLETLKTKNMQQNHNLAKSISSASWSKFVNMLTYKSKWYGRNIIQIPSNYPSSQLCNICGYQNKEAKNLQVREWTCPKCKTHHDRDINASINIMNKGKEILSGQELSIEPVDTHNRSYVEQEAPTSNLR